MLERYKKKLKLWQKFEDKLTVGGSFDVRYLVYLQIVVALYIVVL